MADKKFTIPLRKSFQKAAPMKRTPKAVRALKKYLHKHCKVDEVKIGPKLNDKIWERGIKNPPARVSVIVKVEEKVAKAELEGFEYVDFVKEVKKDETLMDKVTNKLGGKPKAEEAKEDKPAEKETKPEEKPKADKPAAAPKKEVVKEAVPKESPKEPAKETQAPKADKKTPAEKPKPSEKKEAAKETPVEKPKEDKPAAKAAEKKPEKETSGQ